MDGEGNRRVPFKLVVEILRPRKKQERGIVASGICVDLFRLASS